MTKKKVVKRAEVLEQPSIVEGVSPQSFEDACKVVLEEALEGIREQIKVQEARYDVLVDQMKEITLNHKEAWLKDMRTDLEEVLRKHNIKEEMYRDRGCYVSPITMLLEGYPFSCGNLRTFQEMKEALKCKGLPEGLTPVLTELLSLKTSLRELIARKEHLLGRFGKIDMEVRRYRLTHESGLTADQLAKVREMVLRP